MNKLFVEYLDGLLTEEEIVDILQLCDNEHIDVEFHKKDTVYLNSAFDELISTFTLYISSEMLAIASTTVISIVYAIVNKMAERTKGKRVKKITANSIEEKKPNLIIRTNNTKILLPEDISNCNLEKYLTLALKSAIEHRQTTDTEIIVSGDDKAMHIETMEKFSHRIAQPKINQCLQETIDYSKLEEVFTKSLLKVENEKKKAELEIAKEKSTQELMAEKNNKIRSFFMRLFNWVMYALVYTFSAYAFYTMWQMDMVTTVQKIVKIIFLILFGVLAICMFFSQFESFKDSTKEVKEHFNSNIGFAALLVGLIALINGVG